MCTLYTTSPTIPVMMFDVAPELSLRQTKTYSCSDLSPAALDRRLVWLRDASVRASRLLDQGISSTALCTSSHSLHLHGPSVHNPTI